MAESDPGDDITAGLIENWLRLVADDADDDSVVAVSADLRKPAAVSADLRKHGLALAAAFWLVFMTRKQARKLIREIGNAGGDVVARGFALSQKFGDIVTSMTASDNPLLAGFMFDGMCDVQTFIDRNTPGSRRNELSRIHSLIEFYPAPGPDLLATLECAKNDDIHPEIALFIILIALLGGVTHRQDDVPALLAEAATVLADAFAHVLQCGRASQLMLPPIIV